MRHEQNVILNPTAILIAPQSSKRAGIEVALAFAGIHAFAVDQPKHAMCLIDRLEEQPDIIICYLNEWSDLEADRFAEALCPKSTSLLVGLAENGYRIKWRRADLVLNDGYPLAKPLLELLKRKKSATSFRKLAIA